MNIEIITTGGTIEGVDYIDETAKPLDIGIPIKKLLGQSKVNGVQYSIQGLFSKDSRFIKDKERQMIANAIIAARTDKILITHGTYTMVETAKCLSKLNLNKTILLTGAFISGTEPNSDAIFNLDFALAIIGHLDKGVFIAMHGKIFNCDNVRKNIEQNRFETLSE